jgi:hypothetical protein
MPVAKSPVTLLAESLSATPAMGGVKVLAGKRHLPEQNGTPSVVIMPSEGGYDSPHDVVASLVDVDLKILAVIWAETLDQAWDLRRRYLQALKQQAIGNPRDPWHSTPDQAGANYELLTEQWETDPDTARDGETIIVTASVRLSGAPTLQLADGEIDATGLHGLTAALAADAGATDTTITVDSTAGFASSGELSIDSEQIAYTGITATSFTGLTRGLNGTTPAPHAAQSTVTQ